MIKPHSLPLVDDTRTYLKIPLRLHRRCCVARLYPKYRASQPCRGRTTRLARNFKETVSK